METTYLDKRYTHGWFKEKMATNHLSKEKMTPNHFSQVMRMNEQKFQERDGGNPTIRWGKEA